MAKKLGLVLCRVCKKEIDRNTETDWIMPSKNYFYHKKCHEDWVEKKDDLHAKATDNEWHDAMIYYLAHVIKAPIDYKKTESQWKNFLKQNKTAKGIYFAIRYFYDVQKGDKEKSLGGIGIVSSIYDDSRAYWYSREEKEHGICARIEEQMRQQVEQKKIVVKQAKRKSIREKAISLSDIEDMEA
jgi:hypothetical protein